MLQKLKTNIGIFNLLAEKEVINHYFCDIIVAFRKEYTAYGQE